MMMTATELLIVQMLIATQKTPHVNALTHQAVCLRAEMQLAEQERHAQIVQQIAVNALFQYAVMVLVM
jgi:hypothetical protein